MKNFHLLAPKLPSNQSVVGVVLFHFEIFRLRYTCTVLPFSHLRSQVRRLRDSILWIGRMLGSVTSAFSSGGLYDIQTSPSKLIKAFESQAYCLIFSDDKGDSTKN